MCSRSCFHAKFCFVFAETEEIFCNFEEECAFESDWSATDVWSYSVQRRTKWDNTLNKRVFNYYSLLTHKCKTFVIKID